MDKHTESNSLLHLLNDSDSASDISAHPPSEGSSRTGTTGLSRMGDINDIECQAQQIMSKQNILSMLKWGSGSEDMDAIIDNYDDQFTSG